MEANTSSSGTVTGQRFAERRRSLPPGAELRQRLLKQLKELCDQIGKAYSTLVQKAALVIEPADQAVSLEPDTQRQATCITNLSDEGELWTTVYELNLGVQNLLMFIEDIRLLLLTQAQVPGPSVEENDLKTAGKGGCSPTELEGARFSDRLSSSNTHRLLEQLWDRYTP